jgi:hypothetical protein
MAQQSPDGPEHGCLFGRDPKIEKIYKYSLLSLQSLPHARFGGAALLAHFVPALGATVCSML